MINFILDYKGNEKSITQKTIVINLEINDWKPEKLVRLLSMKWVKFDPDVSPTRIVHIFRGCWHFSAKLTTIFRINIGIDKINDGIEPASCRIRCR